MFQIAQIITVMSVPEGSRDIKNSLQKLSCRYFSIYHTHHPLLRRSMAYERSIPPRDTSPIIPSIYYISVVKMCGHSRSTGVSMLSIKRWLVHHLRGRCIVVIRGGLSSSRTNHCHWTVLQYTHRVYILLSTFRCGVVCCGGVMEAHNRHY